MGASRVVFLSELQRFLPQPPLDISPLSFIFGGIVNESDVMMQHGWRRGGAGA